MSVMLRASLPLFPCHLQLYHTSPRSLLTRDPQWLKHPEPSSWISVIEHAHDQWFAGAVTNMYGEKWTGPPLMPYNYWPEFV